MGGSNRRTSSTVYILVRSLCKTHSSISSRSIQFYSILTGSAPTNVVAHHSSYHCVRLTACPTTLSRSSLLSFNHYLRYSPRSCSHRRTDGRRPVCARQSKGSPLPTCRLLLASLLAPTPARVPARQRVRASAPAVYSASDRQDWDALFAPINRTTDSVRQFPRHRP